MDYDRLPETNDLFRGPASRVLWLSTTAFTLMFAVWLMFGILGLEMKADAGLMLGEAAAGVSAAEIAPAVDARFEWLLAVAILAGALLRLHFGIWTDRFGGRAMMILLLLATAVAAVWLAYAQSYGELLLCAALVGLGGNSFSVGIAWNSAWFSPQRAGTALGIFGAGNVGASGTKLLVLLVPGLLTLVPAAGYWGGWIPGGWRVVPLTYAALLVLMALAMWALCPTPDRMPGRGRPLRETLVPLRDVRVWRFSLYYVVMFGAYVALSAWLPSYYVGTFDTSLRSAALLTALFIFPASLLRPVGGWLSDLYGPRRVTYVVLIGTAAALIPLCLPPGLVSLGVSSFTLLLIAVGVCMGIGKASVYKYVAQYFPSDVGAVGGLVGLLGAVGGFALPKLFGWLAREAGYPQAAFLAVLGLTALSLAWLHVVVLSLRASERATIRALPATMAAD